MTAPAFVVRVAAITVQPVVDVNVDQFPLETLEGFAADPFWPLGDCTTPPEPPEVAVYTLVETGVTIGFDTSLITGSSFTNCIVNVWLATTPSACKKFRVNKNLPLVSTK